MDLGLLLTVTLVFLMFNVLPRINGVALGRQCGSGNKCDDPNSQCGNARIPSICVCKTNFVEDKKQQPSKCVWDNSREDEPVQPEQPQQPPPVQEPEQPQQPPPVQEPEQPEQPPPVQEPEQPQQPPQVQPDQPQQPPPPPKTFGDACTKDDECVTQRGLSCIDRICKCAQDSAWIDSICKVKPTDKTCSPGSIPDDCEDVAVKNMECNLNTLKCGCPSYMSLSPAANACKLKGGENCYFELENGTSTFEHDICASQHCINDATKAAIYKECGCTDGQIWSSEPGDRCIQDYYGFPCKGPSECHSSKFNPSREGLVCRDNKCLCNTGFSYSQGYCVVANVLHNEVCDPSGNNPTCKTDGGTSLTCRDFGNGGFRCACLLKDVRLRSGNSRPISLVWNATLQICDLKPNGERCNGNYECKSGFCRGTCTDFKRDDAGQLERSILLTFCPILIFLDTLLS